MDAQRFLTFDQTELKRGSWSRDENQLLVSFIEKHAHDNWQALPKLAGLNRCGKSCRLRWLNYLRPGLKRGNFTEEEEQFILKLHESLGNKWSQIASHLPGRTDNEIKNVWNSRLKKRTKLAAGNEPVKGSILSPRSSSTNNVAKEEIKEEDPFEGLMPLPGTSFGYVNMLANEPCFTSTVSVEERWTIFLESAYPNQQ